MMLTKNQAVDSVGYENKGVTDVEQKKRRIHLSYIGSERQSVNKFV